MDGIILFGICIVMMAVFVQDLKTRSIHILLLGIYSAMIVPFYLVVRSISFYEVAMNLTYLVLVLGAAIFTIAYLKKKKRHQFFGSGDMIFLGVTAFYFDFPGFIIWFNVALIICLGLHFMAAYFSVRYRRSNLVPLAGFLSVIFAPALILEIYVRPISIFIYQP